MNHEATETEKDLKALRDDLPALERRLEDAREAEKAAAKEARASGELDGVADAQRRVQALQRLLEAHREEIADLERRVVDEAMSAEVERLARVSSDVRAAWDAFYEEYEAVDAALLEGVGRMLSAKNRIEELRRQAQPARNAEAVEAALRDRGVSLEDARMPLHTMQLREASLASQFVAQAFGFASGRSDWPVEG